MGGGSWVNPADAQQITAATATHTARIPSPLVAMKLKPYAFWRTLCPDEEHRRSAARLVGPMWSFWTAFEHGFDENALKRSRTRTILTKMRVPN